MIVFVVKKIMHNMIVKDCHYLFFIKEKAYLLLSSHPKNTQKGWHIKCVTGKPLSCCRIEGI
jgi:hypothetical protein